MLKKALEKENQRALKHAEKVKIEGTSFIPSTYNGPTVSAGPNFKVQLHSQKENTFV